MNEFFKHFQIKVDPGKKYTHVECMRSAVA